MANVSSSNGLEKRPKLRFPGFDEPWKMVSLQDISEYRKNKICVSKSKYISTENMLQNFAGIIPYTSEEDISGVEFCVGDTLLANIRPYLRKAWLATHDGACSTDVLALCPLDITPAFLNNIIEQDRFIDYVMSGVKGSKMPRGDKAHILAYETAIPSLLEQEKINSFMQLLHQRIAKIQMEIELLKKYKRGAVTHILSGKSTAFAVTSSWTEHTLSELCSEFRSGRNISATLIHQNGNYPVYGGNGIRGYCNQYSHDGEYVVVGRQGALCGNVRLIQGKNYLSEHAIAVQANEANETKFLLYLLDYMKLGQYSDQGAQPGLAVNKLLRLKCMVPDKQTQIKIASFLMSFDFQISTQERMLMLQNNQRRALLQQLFI